MNFKHALGNDREAKFNDKSENEVILDKQRHIIKLIDEHK
jgi:hypothetical protein